MGISFSGGVQIPPGGGSIEARMNVAGPLGFRYWRFDAVASNTHCIISELQMKWDDSMQSLNGFGITNIGNTFSSGSPENLINDNLSDVAQVTTGGLNMRIYIDFGEGNEQNVTAYGVFPWSQEAFAPSSIDAFNSDDASDWTLVKSFTGLTQANVPYVFGQVSEFDLTT